MYPKQLVAYITERLQAGMPGEEIKRTLIRAGWTEELVGEVLNYITPPKESKRSSFLKIHHSMAVIFIAILLSIAATLGIFLFSSKKTLSYTINIPASGQAEQIEFSYGEQKALSNPDFFGKVKRQFINDKADFIEADLSAMKLNVYKKGALTIEVPINSKGREGSWWETPAGLYKISNKEKEHFSKMGQVWMPWSMNFQGNFFIHGRTYFPDKTLTSAQYTGGCIRLSTEDAKKVYDAIDIGTPLIVFEKSFSSDNFIYDDEPAIAAPIFMAADMGNNHIFTNKNTTEKVPVASITKLLTALVATEYIDVDKVATIQKEALVPTHKPKLKPGMKISIYKLLFPLLLESSDEAAETIARYYGRESFIKHMNTKAASIGMAHSSFYDPAGASENNISTAEDLFMLAKYIYNNRSFIFNITSEKFKGDGYEKINFKDYGNLNYFVGNEHFFGGQNSDALGGLEANISVFELPVEQVKRPVVVIILNSTDAKKDSEAALDFALDNFK